MQIFSPEYCEIFKNISFEEHVLTAASDFLKQLGNDIPEFLDSGRTSWTLDSGRWTLDAGLWALDSGRWTLDSGCWTLDAGRWTLDSGLWTLDAELWTLDAGR